MLIELSPIQTANTLLLSKSQEPMRNRRQPRRDASEIESSRGKNVLKMDFGRTLVACLA